MLALCLPILNSRAGWIKSLDSRLFLGCQAAGFFVYFDYMLTREEVLHIAELARIELEAGEVEKFQKNLSTVLEYVAELQNVNTEGVEEVSQVTGLINVQREDWPVEAENREAIFSQAPEIKDDYFKVKAIL